MDDIDREVVMEVVGEIEDKLESLRGTPIPLAMALQFQQIAECLKQIRLGA